MGNWEIVVPEATTNIFADPSVEKADPETEWNSLGNGTSPEFTRSTAHSYFGHSSALADLDGGSYLALRQTETVTATAYTLSVRLRRSAGGTLTTSHTQALFKGTYETWDSIAELRDGWYLCVYSTTPTAGSSSFGVSCQEDGMYVDGLQLENKAYRTTFCDGDQEGCAWLGDRYGSSSARSGQSRAGGRVYDLDDLSAYVEDFSGTGMPPVLNISLDYAVPPGSEFARTKIRDRVIVLMLWVQGTSVESLHGLRQGLIDALGPEVVAGQQSFWLRYNGAEVPKQARVRYESGLELGRWRGFEETVALRLWAEDPMWYIVGECSEVLDGQDSLSHLGIAGRVDGVWGDVGTPSSGGTVYSIVRGPDGAIYIGGDFTNWDGIANADYIVKWDPVAETYSALGTGMAGGAVYAMCFMPNGDLVAGGAFTGAGGVSNTDEIALWDGSAWNSLGGGATNGTVYAVVADQDGRLYAGGAFTTIAGETIDRIARWDGLYWADVGGAGSTVYAMTIDSNGDLVVGGDFVAIGNRTVSRLASFDGTTWSALGSSVSDIVRSLAVGQDGMLYLAGDFTEPYSYIAGWNGTSFFSLGGYVEGPVNAIAVGPDGRLFAGGVLVEEPVPPSPPTTTGWWDPDGEALEVWGAWRAEGADSYSASLQDESGMGHDLTQVGPAPSWSTDYGWHFDNVDGKVLDTGFTPDGDQDNQTVVVYFSNVTTNGPAYPFGSKNAGAERLALRLDNSIPGLWISNGDDYTYDAGTLPSTVAVAGDRYFLDGVYTGTVNDWTSDPTGAPTVVIGGLNTTSGLYESHSFRVRGMVIYTEKLTDTQVDKVHDEMVAW